jgi:hypothetical protein
VDEKLRRTDPDKAAIATTGGARRTERDARVDVPGVVVLSPETCSVGPVEGRRSEAKLVVVGEAQEAFAIDHLGVGDA